jgi:hypothetical protein
MGCIQKGAMPAEETEGLSEGAVIAELLMEEGIKDDSRFPVELGVVREKGDTDV